MTFGDTTQRFQSLRRCRHAAWRCVLAAAAFSVPIGIAAAQPEVVTNLIGMPFVIAYTGIIYWAFRGKVRLDEHSY